MATYVGVYTPLKVLTPYNTHFGAISGALPTLLGFTAALGLDLVTSPWAPHALWLFGMQVLWQMPHFYSLAWIHRDDYIRGGYKMFPLTDTTGYKTAAMSKPYLAALCVMPWGLSAFGLASWMLPIGAFVPSVWWWRSLSAFEEKPNSATCRRFFLGSLSYLLSMLALYTACARTERQALPVDAENRKEHGTHGSFKNGAVEDGAVLEIVEPLWRASMRACLLNACPHEKFRYYLFGVGKSGCPLCREPL